MFPAISRVIALTLCLSVFNLGFSQFASAAVVTTSDALRSLERSSQVDFIADVLTREDVRRVLESQGVSVEAAMARVDALSDGELQALHQQFEALPAGGVGLFEVLGITFLVLLVLELTGTINIFSQF
jgi:hypothetical protein